MMGFLHERLIGLSAAAAEGVAPLSYRVPIFSWRTRRLGLVEPELDYLPRLMAGRTRRLALDVGANKGGYTYHLADMFERVVAFEPQRDLAGELASYARSHRDNVNVENCGLSDRAGEMEFHVPLLKGRLRTSLVRGCASLEACDVPHETIHVAVKRLDDFAFEDVDFIKIDVEGHELKVIEGGRETLARCRPVVQAEVDHHAEMFGLMRSLGYRVEFLRDDALWPVDGDYLPEPCPRNFLFLPEAREEAQDAAGE
jgi:FkbM family methyltransferase